LSGRRTIGQLWDRYPAFRRALYDAAGQLPLPEPVLEPTGLCVQTCTLNADRLVAMLDQARQRIDEKMTIQLDLSRAVRARFPQPITIQGVGIAPPSCPETVDLAPVAVDSRPEWAARFLNAQATGQAPASVTDEETRRTLAVRAARIEASRRLWLDLEQLTLPDGETVGARLARRSDRAQTVAAVNQMIFSMSKPVFDDKGVATVSIGIRLESVWRMIGQEVDSAAD
jgi:hypothetical protein